MKHLLPILALGAIALLGSFAECKGDVQTKDSDSVSETIPSPADSIMIAEEKAQVSAQAPVRVDSLDRLTIYYPHYSRIDLACGSRPSQADSTVIFIAAGAFTGEYQDTFRHSNIAGDHVSGGQREKGYKCARNTGAFIWTPDGPEFHHLSYSSALDRAARKGGCAFAQEMMIHEGKIVEHKRPDGNVNEFRALCLIDGKVAVADSYGAVEFGDFIKDLLAAGATEALYMDMGAGWNYSWYRAENGEAVEIHSIPIKYSTNWLTFYRE